VVRADKEAIFVIWNLEFQKPAVYTVIEGVSNIIFFNHFRCSIFDAMFKIRKKGWIEIVLHVAFWVGVFYTLLSFTEPHIKMRINQNGTILEKDIRRTLSPHIFLTLGFMAVLFYSNIFWLFKRALRYKNVLIRVILPIAWFSIIFLASNYLDTLLPAQKMSDNVLLTSRPPQQRKMQIVPDVNFDRPPGPLADVRREIVRHQSTAFLFATDGFSDILLFIFIIIFGLSIAYFFLKEWTRAEGFRIRLEAVQLDTEIKFLKSQVNPHFLFNTLNNLFSMAQGKGNDELADGISKLSGMMRYMIYDSNADSVPLNKEIEYLEDCITLNKLRYADDEAKVSFDYPPQPAGVAIAPMLFIPFVENAFKHGVAIGQASAIDIAIVISNQKLIFTCANPKYNAKKMNDEESGIGLENVKRRLDLLYPGKHQLLISEDKGKYFVKLEIDLK
jgi:two-component system LytT family sensor kinase